jgi:hypothetical protein
MFVIMTESTYEIQGVASVTAILRPEEKSLGNFHRA